MVVCHRVIPGYYAQRKEVMMEVKIDGTWTPSHIGLIVRNLDESVNHYESLGFSFMPQVDRDSSQIADYQVYGKKREKPEKWTLRIAPVGPYRIELVCPTEGETIHDQVNVSWPLRGAWSIEGDWKHKIFDGDSYDYSEIRAELSVHRSPRWVLSALYERTTDPAILFFSHKEDYGAGQLEVRFARGHSLRLFVGATKGSVKCAGGVCRLFPAFDGVRLEAFLRF